MPLSTSQHYTIQDGPVLHLPTPEGWKAELTYDVMYPMKTIYVT